MSGSLSLAVVEAVAENVVVPLEREDTGVFRLLEDIPPAWVGDVGLDGPGCNETKGAWNRLRV